ncbi:MAG: undecaprenyl-phosphate glucose phosphotransferase [Mariprofundus sp.]
MSAKSDALIHEDIAAVGKRQMLRKSGLLSSRLQLLLDIAVVEVVLFLLILMKGAAFAAYYELSLVTVLSMVLVYSHAGVYRRFSGRLAMLRTISWAWVKVFFLLIVWGFLTKSSADYSREVVIMWFVLAGVAQFTTHLVTNYLLLLWHVNHQQNIPSLMVGNSKLGKYLADHINANIWIAHKIVGVVCDEAKSDPDWKMGSIPHLGELAGLRSLVGKYAVRRVYLALPAKTAHEIRELEMQLIDLNVDIIWVPDVFGLYLARPSVQEVAGVPLYYLSESPLVDGAKLSKVVMDKVLSVLALILLSPIMIAAAVAVKLSSPGPVFFRQDRHGLNGSIIKVLKFRSMKLHEEGEGHVTQATAGDPRVTRVGAFLRRTSIDELPQLFNVLAGDMSLVGPRPHAVAHNDYYAEKISAYMSRHRILPGITGLAQVNGCRGETDTLEKMEKRVEYDLAYINDWSIWLDVNIMIKTVFTLFSKNAY